jgi:hypothetical protein
VMRTARNSSARRPEARALIAYFRRSQRRL